ncbi:hypothetical protein HEP86_30585 [Streptomyces sp. RPA4-5]|uniref:DUF6099 family protein n=1 Tax=Streptomyces TaxID=1883 RepID=UPI00143EBFE0|nr:MULTISPECIES: DUF6099 family protein [Streptomyces]MCX4634787.1 DUF6099 family protein [Streptomyces platensis]QIY58071.1 hypothetical protein HEP86_30585 [Streptomyces sp. RPA4-5]WJY41228.1 DUF6099 family protein [Streptomyces sp. P9-2B-2]WSW55098.1 DUF6099 family protein [Streptomyces platensis]
MDAVRIIAASRRGLAEANTVQGVIVEAWQAQALAEAVGSHLAIFGPYEVRSRARGLGDAGGRFSGGLLCPASVTGGGLRAAQLSEVRDAKAALTGLCLLLREVCEALVAVVLLADEDGMYWTCVEAMDTVDESRDRVAGILEKLEVRDRNPA